jgi:hypothetical protein
MQGGASLFRFGYARSELLRATSLHRTSAAPDGSQINSNIKLKI